MLKAKFSNATIIAVGLTITILTSCNRSDDIPFPDKYNNFAQPSIQPLKFSDEKKLNWVLSKSGIKKSDIQKLDIDDLPSTPIDTEYFKPFTKPPEKTFFKWNKISGSPFNLKAIPSKPLKFKTNILEPPSTTKSMPLTFKNENSLSILEIGHLQGIEGEASGNIAKDPDGLVWIATERGLVRYDGENAETFNTFPYTQIIEGMTIDSVGRVWYISKTGFGIIDTHNGTISHTTEVSSHMVAKSRMMIDNMNHLWIYGSVPLGIVIIDPNAQTFKVLNVKSGLSGSNDWDASGIIEDKDQNIWISHSTGGADIINLRSDTIKYFETANGLVNDSIYSEAIDSAGCIWLSARKGLEEIDIKSQTIKLFSDQQGIKSGSSDLLCDNENQIWLSSLSRKIENGEHKMKSGIVILNSEKELIKSINYTFYNPLSFFQDGLNRIWANPLRGNLSIIEQDVEIALPDNGGYGSSILVDASGRIWDAAFGKEKGLKIIDLKKHLKFFLKEEQGLSSYEVKGLSEVNGEIWVSSFAGIDIIDLTHKSLKHIYIKQQFANNFLSVIFKDNKGYIWYEKYPGGIGLLNPSADSIKNSSILDALGYGNVEDINQDKQGKIWIATDRSGVKVIDLEKGTIVSLASYPGISDACSKILMPDEDGGMWIGTDKGIYLVDSKQNTITQITDREGLPDNQLLSLIAYNGNVIAGTKNKASIISAPKSIEPTSGKKESNKQWRISLMAGSESLLSTHSFVNLDFVTQDGQFQRWGRGVTVIKKIREDTSTEVTYITGLNIMTLPKYFINKPDIRDKDTLWSSDSFYLKGQIPVDDGFLQSHGVHWDNVTKPYNLPENLSLPYNQNFIQFQFAQAHLGKTDTTYYTFVLEGIDKKWSDLNYKTSTDNYLNLLPGDYTFKVCSKQLNGHWTKPAIFNFTIRPPWWQTWWAYILYILLFVCIIWGAVHFRSLQLLREKRILEEKVFQRTHELMEEKEKVGKALTDLKSTQTQLIQSEKMASLGELTAGIAHEIQNPLNFVNNFSEVNDELINEMDEEMKKGNTEGAKTIANDIKENNTKITHHGKRADAIVKGMLQHSRSSTGVKEPTNINALADEYLRLAYNGFKRKDSSFNVVIKTDLDSGIDNINIIPQDIGRVLLNLYNNAFYAVSEKKKQQPANYEPTVSVSTKKIDNKVTISVSDNGNGIPQKIVDKIFQPFFTTKPTGQGTGLGLSLSYDIIRAHGGEIRVETKEGEGSEFIIQLPT